MAQESLVHCADAARAYNQKGETKHALTIADFCWSLLSWSAAAVEGVVDGALHAVRDVVEHSLETVIALAAGEYILAYHLSKVLFTVVEIGCEYVIDPAHARHTIGEYLELLNQLLEQIRSKKISMRECIKGAVTLGSALYAQYKLLQGLDSFYTTVEKNVVQCTRRYSTPMQYIRSCDGSLFRATHAAQYNDTEKTLLLYDGKHDQNYKIKNIHAKIDSNKNYKLEIKNRSELTTKVPDFILHNRIPLDHETILKHSSFKKTKKIFQGARIYERNNLYYYRDQLHKGTRAHLEVFNKRGEHLREANPLTGELFTNTADKTKNIKNIL